MNEKEISSEVSNELDLEESNNVIQDVPDYPLISVPIIQFPFSRNDDAPNSPTTCPGSTRI